MKATNGNNFQDLNQFTQTIVSKIIEEGFGPDGKSKTCSILNDKIA